MAAILRVKDENGNIVSIPAIKGDKGEKGDPGEKGEKGERGEPGTVDGLPSGGYKGQSLVKSSDGNGEVEWRVSGDTNSYNESEVILIPTMTFENTIYYMAIVPSTTYSSKTIISNEAIDFPSSDGTGFALGGAMLNLATSVSGNTVENKVTKVSKALVEINRLIELGYISSYIRLHFGNYMLATPSREIKPNTLISISTSNGVTYIDIKNGEDAIVFRKYPSSAEAEKYVKHTTNGYTVGEWLVGLRQTSSNVSRIGYGEKEKGYIIGVEGQYYQATALSPTDLSLLQFTEQTLTTEQQSQARQNIGITGIVTSENVGNPAHTTDLVDYSGFQAGSQLILSQTVLKNQGASNSGKFLGIGADGNVVPTEVSGGGGSIDYPMYEGMELIVNYTCTAEDQTATGIMFTIDDYPKLEDNQILFILIQRPSGDSFNKPYWSVGIGHDLSSGSVEVAFSQSNLAWSSVALTVNHGVWNSGIETTNGTTAYGTTRTIGIQLRGNLTTLLTPKYKGVKKVGFWSYTPFFPEGTTIKIWGGIKS